MTHLHPRGVNHLALSTTDMKHQLEFWCDVLGLPLKALYWMHGVKGAYTASSSSPRQLRGLRADAGEHQGNGVRDSRERSRRSHCGGTMQHVAFHVDTLADVLGMRDRLRSRGVQVVGPIDHGFIKSIYFDGPEGLNLEICCGTNINGEAWIDPEVVGLCGITEAELEALKEPAGFERPADPVPQPSTPHASSVQDDEQPAWYSRVIALTDDEVWERMSEPTPPVRTED
jgi:catechol 2,3-dioxygenase-like lactoylglutathione lyase family enzyme